MDFENDKLPGISEEYQWGVESKGSLALQRTQTSLDKLGTIAAAFSKQPAHYRFIFRHRQYQQRRSLRFIFHEAVRVVVQAIIRPSGNAAAAPGVIIFGASRVPRTHAGIHTRRHTRISE